MMKYEVQRIEIWPVAKIVFILSLLLGFFVGLLYAGLFLMMDAVSHAAADLAFDEFGTFGPGFAIFIILGCTFGFSFIYTIGAVIFTVLYNLIAGSLGGLRIDLKTKGYEQRDDTPVG